PPSRPRLPRRSACAKAGPRFLSRIRLRERGRRGRKCHRGALWALAFGLWTLAFRPMSQMLKSSGSMAAATLTSRLLGMVREMVYYSFMGTGWVNDAFTYAFTIPNLFRRLLGEGALTAAFIPIFKEKEKTHGEIEMWRAANAVISGLIVSASIIIAIVLLGVSLALAFGTPHETVQALAGSGLHQTILPTETNAQV